MAEKKTEHPTHAAAGSLEATAVRLYSEAEHQRQKELEAVRQKRADLMAKTKKEKGFAYYAIQQPYYRQGQHFPANSIIRIPEDEEPSVTWLPVEKTGASETPLTTAGQMNEPVRKPTAPFTSEVYEKEESTVETNPPGKETKDNHFVVKDAAGKDTKDAPHTKRPSDKSL
jgi:hypothetical protein